MTAAGLWRPPAAFVGWASAFVLVPLLVAAVLFIKDPLAPVLLIGAAATAAIGLNLLPRPLTATLIANFLLLVPASSLREGILSSLAVNGAVAMALSAWLAHAISCPRGERWNATSLLVVLYISWGIVTLLWAPDLTEARRKLVAWTTALIVLVLVCHQVRSLRSLDGFMRVLGSMGWLLVAASIYTVLFADYDFGRRLKVFEVNENVFGLILIATLPGVMWPVLRTSGARRAVMMALSIVFLLCVLVGTALSGSRGSALAVLLLLLAFVFMKPTRPWGVVGVVLLLGASIMAPFLLDVIVNRFTSQEGSEFGGRDTLWHASLLLFRDYPLTGVGIGNGPVSLHPYLASLTSATNRRLDLPSHQPFLEVGIETGAIGLLIYVSILASALWSFARARRAWKATPGLPAAYYPMVAGITVAYAMAWIKSGGVEHHPSFFALLTLLLAPSLILSGPAGGRPRARFFPASGPRS